MLWLLHNAAEERRNLLALLDAIDLSEIVSGPLGPPRHRLGILVHNVAEAAEHLGHAELTRQLWEQRRAG